MGTRRALLAGGLASMSLMAIRGYARPAQTCVYGPWQWRAGIWSPPAGTVGVLDLRPVSLCGIQGGDPGMGLFVVMGPVDHAYQRLSLGQAVQMATQALLWGDPAGDIAMRPVLPSNTGRLLATLGPYTVLNRPFTWGHDSSTNQVQALHHVDAQQLWRAVESGALPLDAFRRILGYWQQQYGLDEWHVLIPKRLWPVIEGPLAPATTLNDTFNRANSGTLGTSSDGDWSWTELYTNLQISGNLVNNVLATALGQARAEKDLSSSNHYTQATVNSYVSFSAVHGQLMTRYKPGGGPGNTEHYQFYHQNLEGTWRFYKNISTTLTQLEEVTGSFISGDVTGKIESNGSRHRTWMNGLAKNAVTDTAITAWSRTGIGAQDNGISTTTIDVFKAEDLSPVNIRGRWWFTR